MPILDPKALARTHDHPSKRPMEAIELYREATKKPDDCDAQHVASAINSDQSNEFGGISRAEVRAWVNDDGKPDGARAGDVAHDLGWTAGGWTETTQALAKFIIGVYAFDVIEEILPIDGLARASLVAVDQGDMSLVTWSTLVIVFLGIAGSFLQDVLYGYLDPRVSVE